MISCELLARNVLRRICLADTAAKMTGKKNRGVVCTCSHKDCFHVKLLADFFFLFHLEMLSKYSVQAFSSAI